MEGNHSIGNKEDNLGQILYSDPFFFPPLNANTTPNSLTSLSSSALPLWVYQHTTVVCCKYASPLKQITEIYASLGFCRTAVSHCIQTTDFSVGGGGKSSVAPYTAMMWRAIASD